MADPKENSDLPTYKGSTTHHRLTLGKDQPLEYSANADWLILRKRDKPAARLFHVAYLKKKPGRNRPLTFVFNGGPGAASAYLHMGALGPRRAVFNPDGTLPAPPTRLADNRESWLRFTDLVFIDPVGTGFSRTIETPKPKEEDGKKAGTAPAEEKENEEYWEMDRDLDSLGEFIQKFLSKYHRWTAPIFIAGESYGGFRVAKLARRLQEDFGVGLSGAILISPAIELSSLSGSDYDMVHWMELFPALAATGWIHNRVETNKGKDAFAEHLHRAEQFAQNELLALLGQGQAMEEARREAIFRRMAQLCGLNRETLTQRRGRIDHRTYTRSLLRDQRQVCGLYDASLTAVDPFPDRDHYEGPDPTLAAVDRIFRAGVNHHLRQHLKVDTELDYELLSYKVNRAWKWRADQHFFRRTAGAMDDLRYGMVLNPFMQVSINHGYFDLVTPYFSSNRLVEHMQLDPSMRAKLTLKHYRGGHMFYTWEKSRQTFTKDMEQLYRRAVGK